MSVLTVILVLMGIFFLATATLGLLRFPDFYTRMHATGKGDTMGALLTLTGLALYNLRHGFALEAVLVSVKILFIAAFIFLANPTATHAITKAGLDSGVKPWKRKRGAE